MAVRRTRVATCDLGQAESALHEFFPDLSLRGAADRAVQLRLDAVTAPLITCGHSVFTAAAVSTVDTTGQLAVGSASGAGYWAAHRGEPLPTTAAFLYPPGPWRAGWTSLDISAVLLDLPATETFAQQLTGRRFRLVPTGTAPRSAAMLRHWTRVEAWFRRTLLPDPATLGNPLLHRAAFESLACALLETFPTTYATTQPRSDGAGPLPATVRRAVAFIDDNAGRPIGVADVAAAAHLSVRGLQRAFVRELGLTPTQYLRRARLAGARDDLLAADPLAGTTVRAVAARWGFAHPGRFAHDYRAVHGEHPARTLHR
ncbi:helix-turn-helix transcriptional regulator [Kocuria turfanensis]|uniref:HTH araC/xylS-type domain-containing protein n=1 Tax=Kocuria turfanensis TaxID=388357 RepID=A0A512IFS5_9MICC|nr:AraC family transcriptional regulator [Kocuria turfanensis]GEO96520.1 hypothetical protein KTU01_26430 [Kocuria turfanensis]